MRKATVNLENGKKIVITAPDNNSENCYIKKLKMNKKEYDKNYFTYEDLIKGVTLQFDMSDKPNTQRGTKAAAFPYSMSE